MQERETLAAGAFCDDVYLCIDTDAEATLFDDLAEMECGDSGIYCPNAVSCRTPYPTNTADKLISESDFETLCSMSLMSATRSLSCFVYF